MPIPSPERVAKGLWWDDAWNLVRGCRIVDEGCFHCWLATESNMRKSNPNAKVAEKHRGLTHKGGGWTVGAERFDESELLKPTRLKKPRVFALWSDLFNDKLNMSKQAQAFAIAAVNPRHYFLFCTKRAKRMYFCLNDYVFRQLVQRAAMRFAMRTPGVDAQDFLMNLEWPIQNVGMGVSLCMPRNWDRVQYLRETPAAMRFLSCEPLIDDLNPTCVSFRNIDWTIVGGESGGGARYCRIEEMQKLAECVRGNGKALFVKQLGSRVVYRGKNFKVKGKGADMSLWLDEWDLKEREFPPQMRPETSAPSHSHQPSR